MPALGHSIAGGAIGAAVGMANPAVMQQFNDVLEDIVGTIGQSLTPVIQALIPIFRMAGDMIATVIPSAKEMGDFMKPVADFLKILLEAIQPIIPLLHDVLVGALQAFAEAVKTAGEVVKSVWPASGAERLKYLEAEREEVVSGNRVILGSKQNVIDQLDHDIAAVKAQMASKLKTSIGGAARGAEFASADQLGKSLVAGAFGGAGDPNAETADNTKAAADSLKAIEGGLQGALQAIAEMNKPGFPNQ